jgi:hypothetical protein
MLSLPRSLSCGSAPLNTRSPPASPPQKSTIPSPVSVHLGLPSWRAQARFRSKVDGLVPHTQHVNLRIVGEPE